MGSIIDSLSVFVSIGFSSLLDIFITSQGMDGRKRQTVF